MKTAYQPDVRFQDSVLETELMYPTNVVGTPGPGVFYSSIVGRLGIVDLARDLKSRMGSERTQVLQTIEIQNEFGPNGERVFGALNDDKNLIRFVGSWDLTNTGEGPHVVGGTTSYIEITFYGTGLNLLGISLASRDVRASVDGGSEGANITPTQSTAISSRNYNSNIVYQAVSGLSLGVHTVKLRCAASNFHFSGFDVINESSLVKTNPGSAMVSGKKISLASQSAIAYNSGFESGTLGSRGGRVIKYLKKDGTIGKAVQPVDASQATLASTNHTNEEVTRAYHFREFGAGRSDDFSTLVNSASSRAFTLDDGTTTLVALNAFAALNGTSEGFKTNSNSDFLTFTFVGTGIDIIYTNTSPGSSIDTHDIYIDGVNNASAITGTAPEVGDLKFKIASGLPYGTHTVKIIRTATNTARVYFHKFIVYGPKKPTLPSGAVELADYNVMADFVANATAGVETIATGVLRKQNAREFSYTGPWNSVALAPNDIGGIEVYTSTAGDAVKYTFFGTGVEWRFTNSLGTGTSWQLTVDGSTNLSVSNGAFWTGALSTSFYGAGVTSFTASTSTVVTNTTQTFGNGVLISGLNVGLHTITFTKSTGVNNFYFQTIDIITPIHSPKSNLYVGLLNTLTVGNCAISDNRKVTPVKEISPRKIWAQATDLGSNTSTTSSAFIPLADMSTVVTVSKTTDLNIRGLIVAANPANNGVGLQIYVNGMPRGQSSFTYATAGVASSEFVTPVETTVSVGPGTHKIDLYFNSSSGGSATVERRTLTVIEI